MSRNNRQTYMSVLHQWRMRSDFSFQVRFWQPLSVHLWSHPPTLPMRYEMKVQFLTIFLLFLLAKMTWLIRNKCATYHWGETNRCTKKKEPNQYHYFEHVWNFTMELTHCAKLPKLFCGCSLYMHATKRVAPIQFARTENTPMIA